MMDHKKVRELPADRYGVTGKFPPFFHGSRKKAPVKSGDYRFYFHPSISGLVGGTRRTVSFYPAGDVYSPGGP